MPNLETQFPFLAAGLSIISMIWLIAAWRLPDRQWHLLGSIGTGLAAGVIFAILNAKTLPWLFVIPQMIFGIWLCSLAMILIGVYFLVVGSSKFRFAFVVVGALSGLLNGWAIIAFLWFATVSAGGV